LKFDAEISPDVVIASTYQRANQTAAIASEGLGLAIIDDQAMQEWRIGSDATDVTHEQALASWQRVCMGEGHDERLSPLTESHNEFIARIDAALLRIADEHAGKAVLVFTHGGVVSRSFVTFMGLPQMGPLVNVIPRHTALTEWIYSDAFGSPTWVLGRYNDATHLLSEGAGGQ